MQGNRIVVAGLFGLVGLSLVAFGCGDGNAERGSRSHRAALGAGSCTGACGGIAADGSCWCDDACSEYGDCCDDKAAVCDAPPTCVEPPPAPAEGGCFADEHCAPGEHCEGASYCPCGAMCLVADHPGSCVADAPPPPAPCAVTGCSGQICSDGEVVTTCEWLPIYACYQEHGVCERQSDGTCGWTPTAELEACLSGGAQPEPAPDSCAGACGGAAPAGCYCDSLCAWYGDCCGDYESACP